MRGANLSQCMPFKDPCLISAQVLSIVALTLSLFNLWGWYVMIFVGLPACILLQIAWCCNVNKCGFIAAGVLALATSVIVLVAAVLILVWLKHSWDDFCDEYASFFNSTSMLNDDLFDDDLYMSMFNDDFENGQIDCTSEYEESTAILWLSLGIGSAVLWSITGILVLIFACGQRYRGCEEKLRAEAAGIEMNQAVIGTGMGTNQTTISSDPAAF
eukprot:scaffold2196_cov99-Cylindrotheca_fusiformis.AAC.3